MEIFAWNPEAGAETIEAFNARVSEVCLPDGCAVVDCEPHLVGQALVLSLTEASDLPVQMPLAILPVATVVPPAQLVNLEQTLLDLRSAVEAKLPEDAEIVRVRVVQSADGKITYAIFVVAVAALSA